MSNYGDDVREKVALSLKVLGIEMEATTDYGYFSDDWPPGSHHYRVRFTRNGNGIFTTEFHQGSAHTQEPDVAEVLHCLFSDAQSAEDYDFDEWCEEYGYADEPLRDYDKYRDMYIACEETGRKLRSLFPYDAYDTVSELVSEL